MKVLKSLTFGVMSRGSQNPVLARRAKLLGGALCVLAVNHSSLLKHTARR